MKQTNNKKYANLNQYSRNLIRSHHNPNTDTEIGVAVMQNRDKTQKTVELLVPGNTRSGRTRTLKVSLTGKQVRQLLNVLSSFEA